MPYPGPWQTPDTVEHANSGFHESSTDAWKTAEFNQIGPYGSVDAQDYIDLQKAADAAVPANSDPATSFGKPKFRFTWVQSAFFNDSDIRTVHERYKAVAVSPYTGGAIYWYPFEQYGASPEGVIGYQVEGDETIYATGERVPAEVVSATVGGSYIGEVGDDLDGTLVTEFATVLVAGTGTYETDVAIPGYDSGFTDSADWLPPGGAVDLSHAVLSIVGPQAGEDMGSGVTRTLPSGDLTPFLDGLGRTVLYMQMDFVNYDPVIGPTSQPPGDNSGAVEYGYELGAVEVDWVLQPPTFRWVYDAPLTTPPLRHTQRDDRRNSGLNSRQRSLRNTGYL